MVVMKNLKVDNKPQSLESDRVFEILFSFGGGMGGANNTHFGSDLSVEDDCIVYRNILTNEKITLYKRWIVSIVEKDLHLFKFSDKVLALYTLPVDTNPNQIKWIQFNSNRPDENCIYKF